MDNKNDVKEMTEALTKSLDDTQKNSADIEKLVEQVCSMSCQDSHKQVLDGIIADSDTGWQEKIDLIKQVNAEFDQREENNARRVMDMQSAQTQNIGNATNWWANNWSWVAAIGVIIIGIITPSGRKALSTATKYLTTA